MERMMQIDIYLKDKQWARLTYIVKKEKEW
jgi:hypothetical protein